MSDTIRNVLVVAAVLGFAFFMINIRRSKLVIADSIYWLIFASIVLILGLFPQIAFFVSRTLGVASAANLIYLVIIALLLFRIFQMDIKISQLNAKIAEIIQDEAIFRSDYEQERKKELAEAAEPLKIPAAAEGSPAAFAPLPKESREKEPVAAVKEKESA